MEINTMRTLFASLMLSMVAFTFVGCEPKKEEAKPATPAATEAKPADAPATPAPAEEKK
jgi:Na+/H+ antiporter NhaC